MAASLTRVCHKYVRVTSEFARLFAEPTCSVVRYYPDTDQSALHSLALRRSHLYELNTEIVPMRDHSESLLDPARVP
jgi:hypothetical protein